MIRRNQKWLNLVNSFMDFMILFLSYFAASFVRFKLMDGVHTVFMETSEAVLAGLFALVMVLFYHVAGLYGSYRFRAMWDETRRILWMNAVGVMGFASLLFLLRMQDFSRAMLLIFYCISTALEIFKRYCLRRVLHFYRSCGFNQKHILLIGSGKAAEEYVNTVANKPEYGFFVDGCIGETQNPNLPKPLADYSGLSAVMENSDFDEVIIALQPEEYARMPSIIAACEKAGLRICIIPFFNDYIPSHPTVEVMGNCKLINIRDIPLDNPVNALIKRGMDIAGSLVLIVLTSPLMLAAAIGVKLSSPGPVLFRQERVGLNKKTFTMYKFRSMRVNSAQDSAWSKDVDPRKTRFGSFLRKTSMDELPQFFNVLKGDMSLIGPRPEIPFHVEHFKEDIPLYMVRHQVRPGITGWAQVNGFRGDTSIVGRVKCDIWYIENWSLPLDISILFRTVFGGMINHEKM